MQNMSRVILSTEEFQTLHSALNKDKGLYESNGLWEAIVSAELQSNGSAALSVSAPMAEELREKLTVRLAQAGFDEDYSLTNEGRILESIIDKLYMPI
jgi:hypothetical protein